jgi:large subunit ribosomal protein L25
MAGLMEKLDLDARPREVVGHRVKLLRRRGEVPAVLYGHQQKSIPVSTEARALERIWHRAGRSHLVDLRLDGGSARKVLIREYQHNPRTGAPLHADFFAVNLREKIAVDIPVVVIGHSPAVEELKIGQLQQALTTLRIESLPDKLPAQLNVDVSELTEIDQSITIGQIVLPEGVTLVHAHGGEVDEHQVVVKVAPLRVREEAEEAAAAPEAEAEAGEEGAAPPEAESPEHPS